MKMKMEQIYAPISPQILSMRVELFCLYSNKKKKIIILYESSFLSPWKRARYLDANPTEMLLAHFQSTYT